MEKYKIKSEEMNKLMKEREIEKINENKKKKSNQKKRNKKKSFIFQEEKYNNDKRNIPLK